MKNNAKRFIALMTVATMIAAPCAVSAQSITSNSSGVLDYDNSSAPSINKVVLPTVNDNTFDFRIDPNNELKDYYPDEFKPNADGIYFKSTATKGAIQASADTSASIIVTDKAEKTISTIDNLDGYATFSGSAIKSVATSYALYVWIPVSKNSSEGKFEALTKDNIPTYFDIDTDAAKITGFKTRVGNAASDQKVYEDSALTLTAGAYDPADYVTYDATTGQVSAILPGIKVYSGSAAVANELTASDLSVSEAEMAWSSSSEALKIVNKSTSDITVSAKVTVDVQSGTGLTFEDDYDTAIGTTTAAAIAMQIADVANAASTAAITTSTSGSIEGTYTFNLDAATGASIHYVTGDVDPNKGGEEFRQYVAAKPDYEDASIVIKAKASDIANAKEAWTKYADSINAETRPTITVVYSFTSGGNDTVTYTVSRDDGTLKWSGNAVSIAAPEGVTLTELADFSVIHDDESPVAVTDSSAYGLNDDGKGFWMNFNKISNKGDHLYAQFTNQGTTYRVQLW